MRDYLPFKHESTRKFGITCEECILLVSDAEDHAALNLAGGHLLEHLVDLLELSLLHSAGDLALRGNVQALGQVHTGADNGAADGLLSRKGVMLNKC